VLVLLVVVVLLVAAVVVVVVLLPLLPPPLLLLCLVFSVFCFAFLLWLTDLILGTGILGRPAQPVLNPSILQYLASALQASGACGLSPDDGNK
jgi:hypothetical protein